MTTSSLGLFGSVALVSMLASSSALAQSAPGTAAQPPPGYAVQPAPPGYGAPPGAAPGYPPPGYYAPPPGYGYPPPPPPFVAKERRSTGMMVAGIVLTGVGGISLIAGALTLFTAQLNDTNSKFACGFSGSSTSCLNNNEGAKTAGAVVMIAGVAAIGVGIPLWIIGGRKVPVDKSQQTDAKLILSPSHVGLEVGF